MTNFLNELVYSNRIGYRLLRHTLFWATDFVNYLLVLSINTEITAVEVYRIAFRMPLLMLATYFILYYLIPLSSDKAQRGKFIIGCVAVFVFMGFGIRYYKFYILGPIIDPNQQLPNDLWDLRRVLNDVLLVMVVTSMAIAIKLVKNKTELQQLNAQLQEEKKQAELNFLKAQMQPHFLFNTLNTLYSETIQDSGKAQLVILHLSNLLRFILQECNKPLITVEQEIKVMKDFIALEELRHGVRLKVDVKIEEFDQSSLLSPLVFLPFVENCFKHTLLHNRGTIHITIHVSASKDHVFLLVENDLPEAKVSRNGHQGKGIANTRRQLDLLYGDTYSLVTEKQKDRYHVSLSIPVKNMEHGSY